MNHQLYQYYVIDRMHRAQRVEWDADLGAEYAALGLSHEERMCRRFETVCSMERPAILPFEQIVFRRTVKNLPDCFTPQEREEIAKSHHVPESGYVSNLSPNYDKIIRSGLLAIYEEATSYQKRVLDAMLGLCDRYLEEAEKQGREDLVGIL